MRRSVAVPILLGFAACSTYSQHRAALVPRAAPYLGDGQPLDSQGTLALGASSIHEIAAPTAGDPATGVAVPGTQLDGKAALRLTPNVSMHGIVAVGLASTAHAVNASEPPIDNGNVTGMGWGIDASIPTSTPGFRVGIGLEVMAWSIPWIQYTTCTSNCDVPGATTIDKGSTTIPQLVLAVVPSYRTGRVTVFGGVTMRNHPDVAEKITTDLPDADPDVHAGPINFIAHAGLAVELGAGLRASLILHQDLSNMPVSYRPGVAALLTVPLGRDRPR